MPPSSIHMDHVRAKTQHIQAASMDNAKAADKPAENSEGMSFWDVLDVVNPLQHIPVVNKIYQAVTGDTIRTPAKVAGAALFFGPMGLAVASADAILEKETGKDALDHVASTLGLEKDAAPAEDDPFTVTAPRPAQTADATPAPQAAAPTASAAPAAPAPGGPVELSSGQAALLESLMGGGQSLPSAPTTTAALAATAPATVAAPASLPMAALTTKAPATVPTSISAHAPAAGGIATAQQLKDLESTPGASAALTAARGMGTAAVLASLPTPGAAGSGDNLLTAMSQEQAAPARAGKGLAEYRAAAISAGSMGVKPIVASRANQMARNVGGNMPGAAVPAMPKQTTQPQAPTVTNAQPVAAQPQAAPAPTNSPAQVQSQQPASWPPGGAAPLPKELIADMMSRAMDKYDSRPRTGGTNTDTVH
jgi:hypothetical protein